LRHHELGRAGRDYQRDEMWRLWMEREMTDKTEQPTVIMTEDQWAWFQKQEMMRTAAALDASKQHRVAMSVSAAMMTGSATTLDGKDALARDEARRLDDKRDAFAAAALTGMLAATNGDFGYTNIAETAWDIADAMMEARK
jgi:hypothetical protein